MSGTSLARLGVWFTVACWGASFVAADALLQGTGPGSAVLSPIVLAAARFSLAALCFAVPLIRAALRGQIRAAHVWRMAILGLSAYTFYFWLQYTGVADTNAAVASILVVGMIPLMTALVAYGMGQERLTLQRLLALLLGLLGIILIVAVPRQGPVVSWTSGYVFGALCLVANSLLWAFNSTFSRTWMQGGALSPVVLTGGSMTFGAIGLVVGSLVVPTAHGWGSLLRLSPGGVADLLFLTGVCSVAGYFLYNFALTRLPASEAAFYIYFEPLVAIALGVILLRERLAPVVVVGALLLALSAVLMVRTSNSASKSAPQRKAAAVAGSSDARDLIDAIDAIGGKGDADS